MNFRAGSRGRGRVETTLEITPLIDVIFLLLIFFVMTTTPAMSAVERLDVDLPGADSGEAMAVDEEFRVVMRVYPDGRIEMRKQDGEPRKIEDAQGEMERIYAENPQAVLWIQGDVDATHGAVIELMDAARKVGFERVHMAVRPH